MQIAWGRANVLQMPRGDAIPRSLHEAQGALSRVTGGLHGLGADGQLWPASWASTLGCMLHNSQHDPGWPGWGFPLPLRFLRLQNCYHPPLGNKPMAFQAHACAQVCDWEFGTGEHGLVSEAAANPMSFPSASSGVQPVLSAVSCAVGLSCPQSPFWN